MNRVMDSHTCIQSNCRIFKGKSSSEKIATRKIFGMIINWGKSNKRMRNIPNNLACPYVEAILSCRWKDSQAVESWRSPPVDFFKLNFDWCSWSCWDQQALFKTTWVFCWLILQASRWGETLIMQKLLHFFKGEIICNAQVTPIIIEGDLKNAIRWVTTGRSLWKITDLIDEAADSCDLIQGPFSGCTMKQIQRRIVGKRRGC